MQSSGIIEEVMAPTVIQARHPHWSGSVLLDPLRQRAQRTHGGSGGGSGGAYRLDGPDLEIAWDHFPPDRFRLSHGQYFHTDFLQVEAGFEQPTILAAMPGSRNKVELRTQGSDIAVFHQVLIDREYEIKDLPAQASVIVDLGANIGLAALFFAARYPSARIISLEPDPDNFALLSRNVAQLGSHAHALQAAIWSEDTRLQIRRIDETGAPLGDWGVQVADAGQDSPGAIEAWSMQRIIRAFDLDHIDVLKIDIEGAEKELFEAADLAWLDRVGCVVIETHERFRPGSNAAVLRLLDHGFQMKQPCGENNVFVRAPARTAMEPTAQQRELRSVIITAYYRESRQTLEHCIRSVQAQSSAVDHIVVADGHPQDWLDAMPVRHIKLDRAHGDYGNTPRGIGAMLAISEGYDTIGFIDADNWLEPDHVACCKAAGGTHPEADFIIARWNLRRPDGSILPLPHDPSHIDTNCFCFLPGSFHLLPHFNMMHQQLSIVGDRVFAMALRGAGMQSVTLPHPTVNYSCLWPLIYKMVGEEPPKEAKTDIDASFLQGWLRDQAPRDFDIICRRAGVRFAVAS